MKKIKLALSIFILALTLNSLAEDSALRRIHIDGYMPTWRMITINSYAKMGNNKMSKILEQESAFQDHRYAASRETSSTLTTSSLAAGGIIAFGAEGMILPILLYTGYASDYYDRKTSNENLDSNYYFSSGFFGKNKSHLASNILALEASLIDPLNRELQDIEPAVIAYYGSVQTIHLDEKEGILKKFTLSGGYTFERKEKGDLFWYSGIDLIGNDAETLWLFNFINNENGSSNYEK